MAGLNFLRVVSNAELTKQDEDATAQALQERQNQPMVLGLSQHVRMCWDVAKIAKKPIEDQMLTAMRQRNGTYEPDKLRQIKQQGGSEIYMMITEVKCRAAESWLRDILLDSGTPPWDIVPTPIPDLSPLDRQQIQDTFASEVLTMLEENQQAPSKQEMAQLKEMVSQDYRFKILQDAQIRADKMHLKIEDQFAQGGWAESFNDFITDLVTYPCAFIKGPIVRRQRTLGWKIVDGRTTVEPIERLAPEFERVDIQRIGQLVDDQELAVGGHEVAVHPNNIKHDAKVWIGHLSKCAVPVVQAPTGCNGQAVEAVVHGHQSVDGAANVTEHCHSAIAGHGHELCTHDAVADAVPVDAATVDAWAAAVSHEAIAWSQVAGADAAVLGHRHHVDRVGRAKVRSVVRVDAVEN